MPLPSPPVLILPLVYFMFSYSFFVATLFSLPLGIGLSQNEDGRILVSRVDEGSPAKRASAFFTEYFPDTLL